MLRKKGENRKAMEILDPDRMDVECRLGRRKLEIREKLRNVVTYAAAVFLRRNFRELILHNLKSWPLNSKRPSLYF